MGGSSGGRPLSPFKVKKASRHQTLQNTCGMDAPDDRSWVLSLQFHFNPAQSILVMEGEDLDNMNAAVKKVSYINSRQFPTPGARRLRISTSVQYVALHFHRCLRPDPAQPSSQALLKVPHPRHTFLCLMLCSNAVACSFNRAIFFSPLPRGASFYIFISCINNFALVLPEERKKRLFSL